MKPPVTLPRARVVPSGPIMSSGEVAADIAAAVLGVQAVILQGLVKAGLIDLNEWRSLFQATLDGIPPAERQQAYAFCLGQIIASLDAIKRGEKITPKFH
jgi:hypothetical protein